MKALTFSLVLAAMAAFGSVSLADQSCELRLTPVRVPAVMKTVTSDIGAQECQTANDCPLGESCQEGVCWVEGSCMTDFDCGDGFRCNNGHCSPY